MSLDEHLRRQLEAAGASAHAVGLTMTDNPYLRGENQPEATGAAVDAHPAGRYLRSSHTINDSTIDTTIDVTIGK